MTSVSDILNCTIRVYTRLIGSTRICPPVLAWKYGRAVEHTELFSCLVSHVSLSCAYKIRNIRYFNGSNYYISSSI